MTENGTAAPAPPDEDRTPTQSDEAPPIKPAEQWVMPEPVFRRSDGFTPRVSLGNEDPTVVPELAPALGFDTTSEVGEASELAAEAPLIAEQPDLTAEAASEPVAAPPVAKKKGGFMRLLMMIVGIAIIALVVGAAITGVILWYFFQVSESQNLN